MAARRERRRNQGKERHWRRLLREWRRSGLSVRDFCDWQALAEPSFYAWRRELALRDREAGMTAAFVPVQVVADEPGRAPDQSPWLEVQLPSGVQLRVPSGFDRQTLADVLAALEGPQGAPSC